MATKKAAVKEAEVTVKQKLQALSRIQKIDSQIDEIERIKGELPEEIRSEEDSIEGLRTRVATITEDINELTSLVLQSKGKNEQLKENIKRYESQKDDIKNDRELVSLENEIEAAGLDISINEKHIKGYNAQIKDKKKVIEELNEEISLRDKDLETKKAELSVIEGEKAEELKVLTDQLNKMREKFSDKRLLDAYTRIRSNTRNGLAVVPVINRNKNDENAACGGCFNHIPPQRKIDILTAKKIIVCEYCGRILVSETIEEEGEDAPQL